MNKFKVLPEQWNDWKWQVKNSITSSADLSKLSLFSETEINTIQECLNKFKMRITPYYLSLINFNNPCDPIKAQCIPQKGELYVEEWEKNDPLNEDSQSPIKGLVHRYPDRVLFLVSNQCAMYCRHCTRKRFTGQPCESVSINYEDCFNYIREHKEIRDVLLSGGDPLMSSDEHIEYLLRNLRAIPHVEIIRIGTRVPVVLPQRITPELCTIISKYHPVWVNTHFNHPNEITIDSKKACNMLSDAGIPLGNQSVLLAGVNDSLETMKELVHKLVMMRVRPYYLYQCDLSYGLSHFRTPVSKGIEIIKGLRGYTSGYCIPQFVIDAPNGGGKIPINPDYIQSWDDEKISLYNYEGKIYSYPNVKDKKEF